MPNYLKISKKCFVGLPQIKMSCQTLYRGHSNLSLISWFTYVESRARRSWLPVPALALLNVILHWRSSGTDGHFAVVDSSADLRMAALDLFDFGPFMFVGLAME